jgi:hypothetical protein
VGEGDPIPVAQFAISGGSTLGPAAKLATILTLSVELAKRSAAEAVFENLLREEASYALDVAILSDAAATDDNPAGLLNGVTALAPSYGPAEDVATLLGALAAAGGSGAAALIASPDAAAQIMVRLPDLRIPVWPSRALADWTVIAIDPSAFVSAVGPELDIDVSKGATLHMSDTALPIVSNSPTTADPVRSIFQTATMALRLSADLAFTMRAPGLVQYMTGVGWS